KKHKKQTMVRLNAFAAEVMHKDLIQLTADDRRRQYLAKRGLTPEIIKTFKIGITPDSWDHLYNYLVRNHWPLNVATELGLVKKKDSGGYYDIYRNRLMFPIYSHLGDCIGFGGRTLGDDKAKYINSPESELFHKGQIFYGLNETAKYIRSQDQVIVVEGYMDFLALYAEGIKNVVAVLGTALTPQHAKLLKRYTKNVLVLFDGDASGKLAAERSLSVLLAEDLLPRIVVIPQGKDPDDFIKSKGKDEFLQFMNTSQDLFLHVFHQQFKNYSGQPSEKVKILKYIAPILKLVNDRTLQRLYVEEIADTLQQNVKWVYDYLNSQPREIKPGPINRVLTQEPSKSVYTPKSHFNLSRVPRAELYLVNMALMKESYLKKLTEEDLLKQFSSQQVKNFIEKLSELYRQKSNDFDKLTALVASEVEPSSAIT
ncbi:MAG: DNA primase, partial [Bdellovibrionales bacterium]|nr:DNA primase [Bdellovibrionales bacterium]